MAAVDPKDLLIRNKVLVGLYVAALVPIGAWFVLVAGIKDTYEKKVKDLDAAAKSASTMAKRITSKDTENPVYTPDDVVALTARQEAYQKELADLVNVVNQAGGDLEKWFEAFEGKVTDDKPPNTADYLTEWQKQCNLLAERYKPVLTSTSGESLIYEETPVGNELRKFQKRFWVQEAILEGLTRAQEGNPGLPIRMAAKLDFPSPPAALPDAPPRPYDPIPARVTFVCPFPRLPVVLRELLARKIPMRITNLRVDKEPFAYESSDPRFSFYDQTKPRFSIDGREYVFQQDAFGVTLTAAEHYEGGEQGKGQERWIPEPRVKVEVVLEAYDFNPIAAAEKPAEEGEAPADAPPTETTEGPK